MVVVGADAAGMSAASQAKRLRGDRLEVVAFERGDHSSYSACGIPYWVAGDVADGEQLVARTPEAHRANGIDLRMLTEVESIDLQAGKVAVRDLASGRRYREGFDHLVIATGAVPVRPPLPGCDAAGVFGVQTLDDGAALLAGLERLRPRRAVVIGGGYIGVEMAEALARQAGLPPGDHGGIRTDMQMRVLGHDRLWAGGDCVEVLNLVSGQYEHVPLALTPTSTAG
jgi:NADPH-dependent 2,4-dienoyl-CoA reductase/sulfur reductase-like enzyme